MEKKSLSHKKFTMFAKVRIDVNSWRKSEEILQWKNLNLLS